MCASRHVDDFDDDGLEDYDGEDYGEEEEGLSPEDQAAMNSGTEEVRKVLGSDAGKVTQKQIQDALWHYYYDVDKSVGYLKKTFISPPPPPKKKTPQPPPAPKKAPEDGEDHSHWNGSTDISGDLDLPPCSNPTVPSNFFDDMPWLDTPQDRQATFVAPWRPRGGLLGGGESSAGMSKLQKLAAARKKKTEEQKDQAKTGKAEEGMRKLSISESSKEQSQSSSRPSFKRQKISDSAPPPQRDADTQARQHSVEEEPLPNEPSHSALEVGDSQVEEPTPSASAPSAFARTLFGSASEAKSTRRDVFPMPYTSSSSFSAKTFSEPSPDDVVLAAQSQAGKKTPATKAPKKDAKASESSSDQAAAALSTLDIDGPPPKSKGIDVVKEYEASSSKRSISFVVVGHVDAGKSTLMGRLLTELKFVEQRTIDKYRRQGEKIGKQSFALAWVMDQRSEERDRGVTIDIATNYFETDKTRFTILDAPGHRDFVPNMIAGASQADFAILVIDANTGAYEKGLKGQTREHVLLLRSLGVQRIVVAVNKLDMVGYSAERFGEITQEVTGFLTGLGFSQKQVTFVPISGLNGDNIVRPIEDKAASWYEGTTLIEAIEASEPLAARTLRKPLRMPISEQFRSSQGTITLAGRIDSGSMQVGDVIVVQPSGETAHIRSIMMDNDARDWAVAGQNVTMGVSGIDPVHIKVGDIICHKQSAIACGETFTMRAMAFEHIMPSPVDLHRGRLHIAGSIQTILASLDKTTGEVIKKRPKVIQPGGVARVKVKLDTKVPLEAGQRVVIRSGGETVAAGLIES